MRKVVIAEALILMAVGVYLAIGISRAQKAEGDAIHPMATVPQGQLH
jgi:hypothetical protein